MIVSRVLITLLVGAVSVAGCRAEPPAAAPQAAQVAAGPASGSPGKACGGIAGLACGEGEYCNYGIGRCHIPDAQGVCENRPQVCTRIYQPVCGCDGRTYGNACEAAAAGVSIARAGTCGTE